MKIYTRTGDDGETGLFGGGRVRKDDPRVDAYGEIDELNAVLGWVAAVLEAPSSERLRELQEDLFAIGAHLATPDAAGKAATHLPPLPSDRIAQMERWIDDVEPTLPPLKSFILPGGTEAASRLHLARGVCRRAERRLAALAAHVTVEPSILIYVNRLSDLLFTWARQANREAGVPDIPWRGRK